jgi:hypothetical protein
VFRDTFSLCFLRFHACVRKPKEIVISRALDERGIALKCVKRREDSVPQRGVEINKISLKFKTVKLNL